MDISEIVATAEQVQKGLEKIRTRVTGAVMFVDLVGSTDFKAKHPLEDEWLPRLATFLLSVTQIVQTNGRVVKYIGDEVMAFFEGSNAVLNAEHAAEQIIQFCSLFKKYTFEVKISLDYGQVSMLDFGVEHGSKRPAKFGDRDPNGLTVDRCARIMSKATANTILCSDQFQAASAAPARWRLAGKFRPKGIPHIVNVYQSTFSSMKPVRVRDEKMTLPQCLKSLATARKQLAETKNLNKPKRDHR